MNYGTWGYEDGLTLLLSLIGFIIVIYAQIKVNLSYAKTSKIKSNKGLSGQEVARKILDSNGLNNIHIVEVQGKLTDHYDPSRKVLRLSHDVFNGDSIASVSVAAHECGHAIQYHENYMPIRVRNAIIPLCNVGNYLGWIAIMIGLALGSTKLAFLGFFLMCGILAFQIITLPVEINASKRGLAILQAQYLNENEYAGAWQMLYAAALTYVAGVCATLASMLRILFMILSSSNRDSN